MAILGGIKGSRPRGKFKMIKLVRFTNFLVDLFTIALLCLGFVAEILLILFNSAPQRPVSIRAQISSSESAHKEKLTGFCYK